MRKNFYVCCSRRMLLDLQIVNQVKFFLHSACNLRADGVDSM